MPGYMSPVPDPLDFDPNLPGGYSEPVPVLGSVPAPSARTPNASFPVLGAAPDLSAAQAAGLPQVSIPGLDVAGLGMQRIAAPSAPRAPLGNVLASFGIGAPAPAAPPAAPMGPPAPPAAAASPMMPAPVSPPSKAPVGAAKQVGAAKLPTGAITATGKLQETYLGGEKKALEERAAQLRAAGQAEEANLLDQQAAEASVQASRVELAGQRVTAAREAEESAAMEQERRAQAAEATQTKLDEAQKALSSSKLDINAAYGGAAGRIFAGLAVALGSFGASLTGGPNYALQIVDQRINHELDAQRAEIEKRKGKVSELGRLLQQNESLLGDAAQAKRLAAAQTYNALAGELEERNKGRAMSAQQATVLQTLREKSAEQMAQLQAGIRETAFKGALVGAQERDAAMRAQAQAVAAQQKESKSFERELAMYAAKKGIDAATPDQAQVIKRTSEMAGELRKADLPAAAGSYLDIAKMVGIDPYTGQPSGKDPAGLGLVNSGLMTKEGRINRQAVDALAEKMAKSFGGVVTDSDRQAAKRLLAGAGTVGDIQRGVYQYGLGMSRNLSVVRSGDPMAYDQIAQSNPFMANIVRVGQAQNAGFGPLGAK